jgi:hypothetical protein
MVANSMNHEEEPMNNELDFEQHLRIKRALNRHIANEQNWEETIALLEFKNKTRRGKILTSPRTLIELQKYQ